MTGGLLVAAYLAAFNVARTRLGVPEDEAHRARAGVLAGGALLALGVTAALAACSGPLLRSLEITPETFRIAAGFAAVTEAVLVADFIRPAQVRGISMPPHKRSQECKCLFLGVGTRGIGQKRRILDHFLMYRQVF
jgi:acyl-coenzyme A thioesterase PaaI-like protein